MATVEAVLRAMSKPRARAPTPRPPHPALRAMGANVARLRARAGLTQKAFAKRAQVSVSYVSMIEAGRRSPGLDVLGRFARALGAPLHALFLDEAPPLDADPALEPLSRFVSSRRLGAGELERLMAVVDALYPKRR